MTDYLEIFKADPGGDLEIACDALRDEKITTYPVKKMNYIDIADEVGYEAANALSKVINGAIELGLMEKWVQAAMIYRDGLNINSPQVQASLAALVGDVFTSTMEAKLLAAGKVIEFRFPNLRPGHIKQARMMYGD